MPVGTLTFQLPEEQGEFDDAQNGTVWRSVLQDLDNTMRNDVKHSNTEKTTSHWRDLLAMLCADHGLELWE